MQHLLSFTAKNRSSMEAIYRYPGITPFLEKDQNVFFGRDADIENLYHSILLNQCTVISGKSGIGKTSLIYAGIKPRIEKEINNKQQDERFFKIFPIRAGVWTNQETNTLVYKIKRSFFDNAETPAENNFLSHLPDHLKNTLWFKIKQLQFQELQQNKNTVFLLIFDQLEELFTYPFEQFKELLKEFKALLTSNLPDAVRMEMEEIELEHEHPFSAAELKIAYNTIPVKLLFAIRSDKLSLLSRFREAIPFIFQNPYELRPLSRLQAASAIKEPASKEGNFFTPPFTIEEETITAICNFLESQPSTDLDSNFEENKIEPFTLQIICQHIERNIVPGDQDKIITQTELGDPNKIIKNYYETVLKGLNLDLPTELNIRKLIEERMIYEPDQRRLILYKEIITKEYGISEELLNKMVNSKLLRELTAAGSKSSYELSHDWLIIPILDAKKQRLGLSNVEKFDGTIAALEEEVKKNPNEYSIYKRIGDYHYFLQNYDEAIIKYSQAIRIKQQLGIKGGDLELYFSRADCYLKRKEYALSNNDLQQVLAIEPNHLQANYSMAYNYHMTKNYELSEAYYLKVLSIDKSYVNAYYNLALVYSNMNLPEISYDYLVHTTTLNPNDYEAFYQMALVAVKLKKDEEAVEYFKKSIAIKPDYADAYAQLALFYSDHQQPENAINMLKQSLASNPSSKTTWKALGFIYQDMKEYSEAARSFYKCISLDPQDYESYYYLGVMANDQKKYNDAVTFLEKCLQLMPHYLNAYIEKGYAHRMLQQIEESRICFEKVLELDPKNETAARNLEKINQFSESENDLLSTLKNNPDDVNALFDLGTLANNKGKFREAVEYFTRLQKINPQHLNSMIELAYSYYGLKEDEKAINCYKEIIKIDPDNRSAYRSLGKVYDALYDSKNALQYFQKAVELDPTDHDSYYRMGIIVNEQRDYEKAVEYFDKTLQIKPDNTEAMLGKGYALVALGKNEEGLQCYQNILLTDPNNAKAYYSIGVIYDLLNDMQQAETNIQKAIELNPAYYDAYYELGILAHRNKNYFQAMKYFEKCIALEPERAKAYDYYAYYSLQAKDYETAGKYYRKLLEKDPGNANAYFNLGLTLKMMNQLEEALINFMNAAKLKSNDGEALFNIGDIYRQLGNYTEALKFYEQAAVINPQYAAVADEFKANLSLKS